MLLFMKMPITFAHWSCVNTSRTSRGCALSDQWVWRCHREWMLAMHSHGCQALSEDVLGWVNGTYQSWTSSQTPVGRGAGGLAIYPSPGSAWDQGVWTSFASGLWICDWYPGSKDFLTQMFPKKLIQLLFNFWKDIPIEVLMLILTWQVMVICEVIGD